MTRTGTLLLVVVVGALVGPGLAENGEDSVSDNLEDARDHRDNAASDNRDNAASDNIDNASSDNIDNAASDNIDIGAGDARAHMMHSELVRLGELRVTGPGYIHVAMIVVRGQQEDKTARMAANLSRMLASMFQHSRGSPLHLVFITDAATQPLVAGLVRQSVGRFLSET